MKTESVDERLELAASYGEMEINLFLWKKTIKRLRKNGLIVTEKFPTKRKGEFYCNITWVLVDEKENNQASNLHRLAKENLS